MELRVFIENMGAYNEGRLEGEWITLPITEDELQEVLERIGCYYVDDDGNEHNTNYEEYFFTDYECEVDIDWSNYEYSSIDELNEIAEKLDDWDLELLEAASEVYGFNYVIDNDPDDYILLPDVLTDYDLGEYYVYEVQCIDFGGNRVLENYFDFEAYGRDIRLDGDGDFTSHGWLERY